MKPRKKTRTEEKPKRIITLAATVRADDRETVPSDVLGSYTGVTEIGEKPEQDADDL